MYFPFRSVSSTAAATPRPFVMLSAVNKVAVVQPFVVLKHAAANVWFGRTAIFTAFFAGTDEK